jgi:RimJ/RimL family protein N-acetyltransferase
LSAEEVMEVWENLSSVLEGSVVRLEPLAPRHERGLFEVARDPEIWRWSPYGAAGGSYNPAETRENFHSYFEDALGLSEAGIQVPFATLDASTGEPIGSTRYLALRPEHRGLEIGYTWLTPTRWRTGANVEAKLLMLDHAFGSLGCVRVEFKTDARNERSRAALAALPAQFEGIFRKHMLVRDNERRDSAYYSIIDDEWPEVRANLRRRLEAARQSPKRDMFLKEAP